jgi:flagellar motor switch/type III secretory pathway protein FliN
MTRRTINGSETHLGDFYAMLSSEAEDKAFEIMHNIPPRLIIDGVNYRSAGGLDDQGRWHWVTSWWSGNATPTNARRSIMEAKRVAEEKAAAHDAEQATKKAAKRAAEAEAEAEAAKKKKKKKEEAKPQAAVPVTAEPHIITGLQLSASSQVKLEKLVALLDGPQVRIVLGRALTVDDILQRVVDAGINAFEESLTAP